LLVLCGAQAAGKECTVSEMTFGSVELAFAYDELSDRQFTHGKELIGLLGIGRSDRVLDIGCGIDRRRLARRIAS
jgi:ubiquinone/menaquinone biosynthesis C-methylase UbiE